MDQILTFFELHGAPVIFVIVFLDQLGLPIPTVPILLMFGALAGTGRVEPLTGLLVAVAGSLCADLVWFQLGRWKGTRVLSLLCRISLEPDTCVSKTQALFARHGVKSLLVAKFVPGYDTVAPPLAGLLGVGVKSFILWSAGGALLWLTAYGGLGYLLSDRIAELAARAEGMGNTLGLVVVALFGGYLAWKVVQRQRVLREIRMARVTPEQLHEMIVDGRDPVLVDARSSAALDILPFVIPGARLITLEEIDARHAEIPRDRDVIVYCSCPNELSSARMALKLQRLGIQRVRPLLGGIEVWHARRFPVVPRSAASA
jgi:membrane protein DedA with SNARE-associated domain/rhodanese-related sulfurtransferase